MWFNELLHELGNTMSMPQLQANSDGVVGLQFASGERLIIEHDDDDEGIQLSLLKTSEDFDLLDHIENTLRLCHYQRGLPFVIAPGLMGDDTLTYSIYLERDDATPSNLDKAIDLLKNTAMAATS